MNNNLAHWTEYPWVIMFKWTLRAKGIFLTWWRNFSWFSRLGFSSITAMSSNFPFAATGYPWPDNETLADLVDWGWGWGFSSITAMSSNFPFTATGYWCFFPLFCITGTTSVGSLGFGLSIGFCDCIGLTCATCLAFSGSVETGPTVERRENICHIQTIKRKAPHTKLNLHALVISRL